MHRQIHITEADLHAYVDGHLGQQRRAEIELYLEEHPQERERVRRYQELNQALRIHFDPTLDESVPDRLLQRFSRKPRIWRWSAAAAAGWLIFGGVLGAALQYGLMVRPVPEIEADLIRPAAFAHAIYTPEVRHPVDVTADQEGHLVSWLSKRLHTQIRAPNLSDIDYHLVGGRLLPSTNRMAAQFMYEDSAGHRITLYVRTGAWQNRETAFRYAHEGEVGVFYWIDDALGYAISGEVDKQALFRIAATAYRELGQQS